MNRVLAGCLAVGLAALAAPAGAQEELVFGQIASTTNISAAVNATALNLGYQIYFKEMNARGGIHGRMLKVVNKDDNFVAERMVALTRELIEKDNAMAVGGYLGTAGILAVVKQNDYGQANVPFIAPVSGLIPVVRAPNVFPLRPGFHEELERLVVEAKETQKKRLAIVRQNPSFDPGLAKVIEEAAKKQGVAVVASVTYEAVTDKLQPSIGQAVDALSKAQPDAVIMINGGGGAIEFVKKFRSSKVSGAQIYGMSVLDAPGIVKAAGVQQAKGVVISQALPFPYSGSLPVVREYQQLMKKHAPGQPLSFMGLEGMLGAKIFVEGLKRAGPKPTRKKLSEALLNANEIDLGGLYVNYSPKGRQGSVLVDLTIISSQGQLIR